MDQRWPILADDLTGAADCAVAVRPRGTAAAVTWGEAVQDERIPVVSDDADSLVRIRDRLRKVRAEGTLT